MSQENKSFEVFQIELLAEILEELKNISEKLDSKVTNITVENLSNNNADEILKRIAEGVRKVGLMHRGETVRPKE